MKIVSSPLFNRNFKLNNHKNESNLLKNQNVSNNSSYLNAAYPKNYYINSVSFTGRRRASGLITVIGEEYFPSPVIVEKLRELGNEKDYSLRDVHLEHYRDLLDCKTLDEAKEKYPEFKDTIDAKEIDVSKLDKKSILYKIADNKVKGANINTLTLDMLKKIYAQLLPLNNKDAYWNLSSTAIDHLIEALKIKKLGRRYTRVLFNQTEENSERTKEQWDKSPERKAAMSARKLADWENPEYRKQVSSAVSKTRREMYAGSQDQQEPKKPQGLRKSQGASAKKPRLSDEERHAIRVATMKGLWENPEYRKMMSEMKTRHWQENPEYREKMSKIKKKQWANPEYRESMEIVFEASREAYKKHPEILKKMKELAGKYKIRDILQKEQRGESLSEEEKKRHSEYFQACVNAMQGYQEIIGKTQREILAKLRETEE